MDRNSSVDPDGFNGFFYKYCWDIIKSDFHQAISEFFASFDLPKSQTSTLILPIPKVENPIKFIHMRPISLCNFSSKVISKLLCNRLEPILQKMIFP